MTRYTGLAMLLVFLVCVYAQVESVRRKTIAALPRAGVASWYLPNAGDDPAGLTCAMRSTDFGRKYRVCNAQTGACVVVVHTTWGPDWAAFRQGRVIDLSKAAFSRISDLSRGTIRVTVIPEEGQAIK